jgi:hypothetical protein
MSGVVSEACCNLLHAAVVFQGWYEAMHQIIVLLGSSMTGSIRREYSLNNGSISAGLTPGDVSIDPSPFASPVPSIPVSVLAGAGPFGCVL